MFNKTTLKRLALLVISVLGFGLMTSVPATAAITDATAISVTTATFSTTPGNTVSTVFTFNPKADTAGDTEVTATVDVAAAKANVSMSTTGASASWTGKATLAVDTNGAGYTDNQVTYTYEDDYDWSAAAKASGTVSFTATDEGTYVVTLTAQGGEEATVTVTVTDPSSIYVSKRSSVNYTTANLAAAATSDGATVTFAAAHGLTSTSIGKAIYSIDYGYIGTIASITSATVVELTAAATTALVGAGTGAVGKLRIGTPASTYTTSAVLNAAQISSLTATAGKTVALDVVAASNASASSQVRASLVGYGVVSSEIDNATLTHFMLPFTAPSSPGTYTVVVEYSADGSFDGVIVNTLKSTISLVVTAAAGLDTSLSTAYIMGAAAGAGAGNLTTNAAYYSAYKTSGTKIAQIEVTLKNSDGTAATSGHTVAASVTGSGFVTVDNTVNTAAGSARASSAADGGDGIMYVHIAADGTAGTGTITVTVTDAVTAATTTLGTWTVTSYGAVSAISVSKANWTIGYATGDQTGRAVATVTMSTTSKGALDADNTAPAFIVKTVDSVGQVANISNDLVPTIVSSNPVAVSGGTCVRDNGTNVTYSSGKGVGYYNCSFTTTAASKSGDKATLTIRTLDPADSSKYLTTTLDVTVGGDQDTESLSFDSAEYEPGAVIVATRTCVDDKKNPCADGLGAPAIVFNKQIGGSAPGTGFYVGGKLATSSLYPSLFAPTVSGAFEGRMTGYVGGVATQIKATANVATTGVSSENTAQAAADAANEATDAANAATDAANAAAEAADAATAAAQDAQAAVADLAAQVATLIAGIKSQLTSLSNLIVKIQKKVKA